MNPTYTKGTIATLPLPLHIKTLKAFIEGEISIANTHFRGEMRAVKVAKCHRAMASLEALEKSLQTGGEN